MSFFPGSPGQNHLREALDYLSSEGDAVGQAQQRLNRAAAECMEQMERYGMDVLVWVDRRAAVMAAAGGLPSVCDICVCRADWAVHRARWCQEEWMPVWPHRHCQHE